MHRFVVLLCLLFATPALAQPFSQERHISIELVAETAAPAAGGEVAVALVSRPDAGWHGYWKNPGDAGIETQAKWALPDGMSAGPIQYPVPQRLLIAGLMNYVYEGPFAQIVTLKLPAGLAAGTRLPVSVDLQYLVCTREICVPESQTLTTELMVGDGAVDAATRARFDGWRRMLPKPLGAIAHFAIADGRFRLGVPFPADAKADDIYFYPLTSGAADYAAPQTVSRAGDMLTVETKAAAGKPSEVAGVLSVGGGQGFEIRAVLGDVAAAKAGGEGIAATAALAFLGAVLGGLLLNVMPCVFPILSLKALGLARSGESEAHASGEALAYSAGVIVVCVALGALLLGLRAGGASAGWAFQLQDPRVIVVLLLLVTGIAFNLAGLFELATPGAVNKLAANGKSGAFATGALAAFVATPCTGPFMGAALGAALVLPVAAALLVFAGLGLGIALPFLALGFIPALRRRLPKPGAWMETMRRILSVPMFATALALAWVLGRQAGVDGMTLGLAAAALLTLGLWWSGRRQVKGGGAAWVPGAVALLLSLGAVAAVEKAPAQAAAVADGHEAFSETKLASLRGEDRPVFAYFTADWCLTCKVNEKVAIETDSVKRAFADGKVAVLVGDWTDGDPALGRFIEQHNRAGVPLYLWYPGGSGEPTVLPQILTQSMLVELVQRSKA